MPDSPVRRVALAKLASDAQNVESIACFALLSNDWRLALRRVVRFQLVYELLDGLSELYPVYELGMQLHEPLVESVQTVSLVVVERTRRIAEAQSLNHADGDLRQWGEAFAPDLAWWEAAAAGICSLGALAMLSTHPSQHEQIRTAYVPVDALAALLDALVDLPSDRQTGNHNWLEHYDTEREAAERVELLIRLALDLTNRLPQPRIHRLLITGLLAHALSAPGKNLPLVRLSAAESLRVRTGAVILRARHIPRSGRSASCSIQN